MAGDGYRNLEVLWKAHLRLEDRLSNMMDDLRKITCDLCQEVQAIHTRKGTSPNRNDINTNHNGKDGSGRRRHEPRVQHNNRAIPSSDEDVVNHTVSDSSETRLGGRMASTARKAQTV